MEAEKKKKLPKMGWFSEKQARQTGTYVYSGLCGGEVEITCVSSDGKHGMGWDDVKFVGEVLDALHKGRDAWEFIKKEDVA